jgi:DNA-binding PadR family transcriptional regulator
MVMAEPAASVLNATQGSLLGFLHEGPRTGWDLIEEVRRGLARFWNVTSSHVYRELKTLEARGFVRARKPGPRDRQPFAITASGRRAFAEWIHEEPAAEQIRVPLLVTLWFAKHLDAETLATFLDNHRVEHEQRLSDYRALVGALTDSTSSDPHVRAVIDFGIAYEQAFVAWLDNVSDGSIPAEMPRSRARPRVPSGGC